MGLGIHILGPGFGESIIIELPDGSTGVVDVFGDAQGTSPVTEFVQSLGATSLAFLAITHPHADHCTGLKSLLESVPVEKFWLFHSYQNANFFHLLKRMYKKGAREAVEEDLELRPGMLMAQIGALELRAREAKKKGFGSFAYLRPSGKTFVVGGGEVKIRFLTPGDTAQSNYEDKLKAAWEGLLADGPRLNPGWKAPELNYNLISGSLLLEYHGTRILLMGDAEEPLWRELLDQGNALSGAPAQLIKVAHHGSTNGYLENLYEAMGAGGTPTAVITPFVRHRFPLPTQDGITNLKMHASEILCTNRSAAESSSKLTWEPAQPFNELLQGTGIDPGDLDLLRQEFRPEWLRYTILGGERDLPSDEALPRDLVALLAKAPSLLRIVHPMFRNRHVVGSRPSLADEFRVSFYFDEDGEEDLAKRYMGWGTGKLKVS